MSIPKVITLSSAFLICSLVLATPTTAMKIKPIQDGGNFFSKEAIKSATDEIAEIKKAFKKDVIIETIQKVPLTSENSLENSNQLDPAFSEWAKKRLAKTGSKNIYIVVSRQPSYIMAAVGSETRSKGEFSEGDRNALIKLLADNFQQRDYNKGLVEGIRFVRMTMDNNLHGRPAQYQAVATAPNPKDDVTFLWRWIGFGCAGLLAVLLVTGLIKGFKEAPVKPPESTPSAT